MDVRPLPEGFDAERVLHSDVLSLHPLQEADRPELLDAAGDPKIWAGHPAKDRWKPENFGEYFDFLLAAGGTLVARDGNGAVIGLSRFYASTDAPHGIGIGFTFLVRAHWGGATNFEMKRLMVERVFATCSEVWFHIAPTNMRSQSATAKLGAEPVENAMLDLGTGTMDWSRMVLRPEAWQKACAQRS